ncbi:MAG: hypothetical protein JJE39_09725 [Vicinamibacteria bacterium]|nr:hypothetical protein [Vicinamibacteria bacterium]
MKAPEAFLRRILDALAWWIGRAGPSLAANDALLVPICTRLLELTRGEEASDSDDPVFRAINHPVGHATEAVFHWWLQQGPGEGAGIRPDVAGFFGTLCDPTADIFVHGRVILAGRLATLYWCDPGWTDSKLLPFFEWQGTQIVAVWTGFLFAPRLNRPLLERIRRPFIETAHHIERLNDNSLHNYASVLTYVALEPEPALSLDDLRPVVRGLPVKALDRVSLALSESLGAAGAGRADLFRAGVNRFMRDLWPQDRGEVRTASTSEHFARCCVRAAKAFPEAVQQLSPWLAPVEHQYVVVSELARTGLCSDFPRDSLAFLDQITDDRSLTPAEFEKCLDAIRTAAADLSEDPRFVRLSTYFKQRGAM